MPFSYTWFWTFSLLKWILHIAAYTTFVDGEKIIANQVRV